VNEISVSLGRANFLSQARAGTGSANYSVRGISARPRVWLGGASAGGLALPPANPTRSHMYAPRAVWTDGTRLIAADTGNHRVLIWHSMPTLNGAPADVVLGQADFTSEGPAAAGTSVERGFYLPTGVSVIGERLVVCDAWHHRIVAFDDVPTTSYVAPTYVLGQDNLSAAEENRGGDVGPATFYWPFGVSVVADTFWVADTGNRRVLGWTGSDLPEPDRAPDFVLGQDDFYSRADNKGTSISATSFRWPHAVAGDERTLFIADAGDHRVMNWSPAPVDASTPASGVLGQDGFDQMEEFKIRPQGAQRMRFPYSVVMDQRRLCVADTSNNRILVWHDIPRDGVGVPADTVLGQPDMDANGENRWLSVSEDSLCWPYGLSLSGSTLAIADSGNNRVVVWEFDDA